MDVWLGFEPQSNARLQFLDYRAASDPRTATTLSTAYTRVCLSLRQAESSQILVELLIRTSKSIERVLDSRSSVPHVLRNMETHYCVHSRSLD